MFNLSNGVRQGGVISALLYCFYCNDLFDMLRKSGYGCWLNGNFHGIFGYSDDNLLLAPSVFALQEMLRICERYAEEHNLTFSTDMDPVKCKTKCTAFVRRVTAIDDVKLCGNKLPWVDQFKHLGNTISNKEGSFIEQDTVIKRAQFISKSLELNQEFSFASSRTKFQINHIYNSHFYGSPLWDLSSKSAIQLESSYNQSIKVMFNLPVSTHRMLIEPVSGAMHLRRILMSRFLGFLQQIRSSRKSIPKLLLSHICHDVRSTTGKNLRNILLQTDKIDVEDLIKTDVKEIGYFPVPTFEKWKVDVVSEIIDNREGRLYIDGFDEDELNHMINHICTS